MILFGTIILISIPYFVAVVAAIIYSNKQVKKAGNIAEDKEDGEENDHPQLGD